MATIISDSLLYALKMTESSNNPKVADGDQGKAKGILQIWKVVIEDVNRVYKTKYVHADAYVVSKAEDICRKYLTHYGNYYSKQTGKPATDDILARMWNGGPDGYKQSSTLSYWNRVQSYLTKKK